MTSSVVNILLSAEMELISLLALKDAEIQLIKAELDNIRARKLAIVELYNNKEPTHES